METPKNIPDKKPTLNEKGFFSKIDKMPFGKALQGLAVIFAMTTGAMSKAEANVTKPTAENVEKVPTSIEGIKKYADNMIIESFPEEFQKDIHGAVYQVIEQMNENGATTQEIFERIISSLKNIHDKLGEITSPTK